ncbi:hypothetical protein [Streptomyces rhizosphaericus]|uniref:hypothetical protein n=1 Tax=Streptomyces rhizosphaericus TaxID=114699 RepID=UPI0019D1B514|nr:hypothetical protein [Streptomyces rhizosphaericus]
MPRRPNTSRSSAMRKGGYAALEAVGMVITALAVQAMIRALLDQGREPLWGNLSWVPGGLTGQMILLGLIALVAMVSGGWAHTRKEPATERAGHPGGIRDRGTT